MTTITVGGNEYDSIYRDADGNYYIPDSRFAGQYVPFKPGTTARSKINSGSISILALPSLDSVTAPMSYREEVAAGVDVNADRTSGFYGITSPETSTSSTSTTSTASPTISQQDYFVRQGESITDYNARIAALRAGTTTSTAPSGIITDTHATGNQYIMGPNGYYIPYVSTATAPTNTGQVGSGTGTTGLPSSSPTYGNISSASASNAGLAASLDTQMQAYQQQLALAESQQAQTSKSLLSFLSNSPSQTDLRADAYRDIGVDPAQYFADQKKRIAEIDALTQAYNAQVAAKDAAIAQSYDKLATNSFINNQIGQIERNAAPRLNQMSANINSKAAVLQALQGNFAEARSFVSQAVEDAVADRRFKLELFQTMYQMNEDKINRLDDKYQTAFKYSMELAQKEYDAAREEKMAVGELMLKYYESGITTNDTLDEALAKAVASGADPQTAFQNALDAQQEARLGSEGSMAGSTSSVSIYAQAYLDGLIELTSVPEKLRAQVIAEANRIAEEALNAPLPAPTQQSRSTLSYLPGAVLETLRGTSQNFFSNLFGN